MSPTPTTLCVLAVVPDHGRYLVVEERDGSFYLPAGKVDPGEDLLAALARETAEEAGIAIEARGLLGFDHEPRLDRARMRFVFVAAPIGPLEPKRTHDRHSRGAFWLTLEEIARLPLRHAEVLRWIRLHESGRALLPALAYEPWGDRGAATATG